MNPYSLFEKVWVLLRFHSVDWLELGDLQQVPQELVTRAPSEVWPPPSTAPAKFHHSSWKKHIAQGEGGCCNGFLFVCDSACLWAAIECLEPSHLYQERLVLYSMGPWGVAQSLAFASSRESSLQPLRQQSLKSHLVYRKEVVRESERLHFLLYK